ncbi:MAG: hydrolase TatD [Epsilonproteobacteria bacterium]|nr:MAG: hydrolase TatD [Campylobacterota bacterium]
MVIIDTHCHLDNIQYKEDIDDVIKTALDSGVKAFLIPGADLNDLPNAVALSEKYNEVFFAVGVHPYDIDNYDLKILEKYVNHPKCIAVGECGLDYYRLPESENEKKKNIELQKEVFISQINFAKKVKKPLIIHIRDASDDSKTILIEHNAKEVGGVLHCFNASEHLLDLSNHNFYFGIGGVVTFKNAKKLVEILPKIPLDRLVVETDGPYLTPTPFRGQRNEPKYTNNIVEKIAEILLKSKEEMVNITTKNAKKLFKEFNSKI